jgi:hypothetical protein
MSASATDSSARRTGSVAGSSPGAAGSPAGGLIDAGSAAVTVRGQAGASAGASSAASTSSSTGRTLSEQPAMSSAVRKAPAQTRTTSTPRSRRFRAAASATMDSSMGGVAPNPFTSNATRCPGPMPRSDTIAPASRSTTWCTGRSAARSTPGSPWMPSPHSTSSPSSRKVGRPAAGTVHGLSATPIVPTVSATRCARPATSSSGSPAAAAAPATLCTSTVPASPRRPAPVSADKATSSATTTVATSMPSARASSAASPKFSRSPV